MKLLITMFKNIFRGLVFLSSTSAFAWQAPVCEFSPPAAQLTVPHCSTHPELTTDPSAACWRTGGNTEITKDCSRQIVYPNLRTSIRAFWTDDELFLLFQCPYSVLNLFTPPDHALPRVGLWDRDVVEMFLGDDWSNIRHYREFEIAPTGDWIDLAIDLDHESNDHSWRSGWHTTARIDEAHKVWYAAARIPLRAVSAKPVAPGTRWRMNLYRIDGLGPDTERHFLCWQPTCVQKRDPNHVPEHFGTLVFEK